MALGSQVLRQPLPELVARARLHHHGEQTAHADVVDARIRRHLRQLRAHLCVPRHHVGQPRRREHRSPPAVHASGARRVAAARTTRSDAATSQDGRLRRDVCAGIERDRRPDAPPTELLVPVWQQQAAVVDRARVTERAMRLHRARLRGAGGTTATLTPPPAAERDRSGGRGDDHHQPGEVAQLQPCNK